MVSSIDKPLPSATKEFQQLSLQDKSWDPPNY